MKKFIMTAVAVSMLSAPVLAEGIFYNDTVMPSMLSNQGIRSCKVGKATCDNYMNMVQLGDCSYDAAMRNGKITQVNHHDTYTQGWFFFKHITTRVYGE